MKNKYLWSILSLSGIGIVILDPQTTMNGVRQSLSLCIETVIPALFPFLILTHWAGNILSTLSFRKFKKISRWFGIPPDDISIFILGCLGGYPSGAQLIYTQWEQKRISVHSARYLLSFCNNAGPAFIFGMGSMLFSDPKAIWCLWGIQIVTALLTAKLNVNTQYQNRTPNDVGDISFVKSVERAVKVMGIICGWVTVFRILLCFLEKWVLWFSPVSIKVFVSGLLEISNGCTSLSQIETDGLRFILCALFMSFGGFSVWMQTASCVKSLGLNSFVKGKLCQTALTAVIAILTQFVLFPPAEQIPIGLPLIISMLICMTVPLIYKKTVAFPGKPLYNTRKQKGVILCSSGKSR